MISIFFSILLTLKFVHMAEPQQMIITDVSSHGNLPTVTSTPQESTSTVTFGDSTETQSRYESDQSVEEASLKTPYSPKDAFFQVLNPFMFHSSSGLTCVDVVCNQYNFGGFSGVTTCVGLKCNQNNFRKKRTPEAQFGFFDSFKNWKGNSKYGFGGAQKCIGSQCNQNKVEGLHQKRKCFGSQCNQRNINSIGQDQNCQGSECNQDDKDSLGQKHNCLGSQCNQNNDVVTDEKLNAPFDGEESLDSFQEYFKHGTKRNCIGFECDQEFVDAFVQKE